MGLNLIGQTLGKYRILEEIDRGGMGVVYKAHDTVLDRLVAIKVLAPHLTWDQEFVKRFLHEAHAAARLKHPNMVTIYYVAQARGYHFIRAQALKLDRVEQLRRTGLVIDINRKQLANSLLLQEVINMSVNKVLLTDLGRDKRILLLIILHTLVALPMGKVLLLPLYRRALSFSLPLVFRYYPAEPPLILVAFIIAEAYLFALLPPLLVSAVVYFVFKTRVSLAVLVCIICYFVTLIESILFQQHEIYQLYLGIISFAPLPF